MSVKFEKKFMRFNNFDTERFLSYLKDMAKKGRVFHGFSVSRIIFEVTDPIDLDFSCGYEGQKYIDNITKDKAESHWDLICKQKKIYYYKRPAVDPNSTDYRSGMSFENIGMLYEKTKMTHALIIILAMLNIAILSKFANISLTYRYLHNANIAQFFMFLFSLYLIYITVDQILGVRKLKHNADKNICLSNSKPYKNKLKTTRITSTVAILASLLYLIVSMSALFSVMNNRINISYPMENVGVMTLEEFSNEGYEVVHSYYEGGKLDYNNYIERNRSIFVPTQIEVTQHFKYPDLMWNDGSDIYTPSIRSLKYGCLSESIAKKLCNDLRTYSHYGNFEQINNGGFDELWSTAGQSSVYLIARSNKEVYMINYYGHVNQEDIIEALKKYAFGYNLPRLKV